VNRPWHALLAALPEDAPVDCRPVLSAELADRPESAAIAGWTSLSVHLTAGQDGLRHVLVTLDADGRPISAGDSVLYRAEQGDEVTWTHESIGGRLEPDGTVLGTRWRAVLVGPRDSDEAETREQRNSTPSAADIAGLEALVAEVMRRAGGSGSVPEFTAPAG
jgi:hypothetical protein